MSTITYTISASAPREEWADLCRAIERGERWTPRTPVYERPMACGTTTPLRNAPPDRLRQRESVWDAPAAWLAWLYGEYAE